MALQQVDGPEGATPLDPDELSGLRLAHISTRQQLNEAEHLNIQEAALWLPTARIGDCLSENFLRKLHVRMFGEVWDWAGDFRKTEKNIGVDPLHIPRRPPAFE
ncbi:MAG: hypothetical protein AABY95_03620 [Pseudomonadota bacterium]